MFWYPDSGTIVICNTRFFHLTSNSHLRDLLLPLNNQSNKGTYIKLIIWLIDWLIAWRFTARQHNIDQFVPIYQGGLLAPAFEDN